ncbi:MAG: dolichyl-phosphate beta-D-mannosyltransferase [Candidatus Glassbacteria bacterium RIFCSPLOWO2_12_FULL_58_11]|uniref:Dolichyl-phosphate beta-D-mannosyltransferase n=2 Tax=Candidatus Glassiibacteriota TaxID=1817805 RepID=A0A1F5YMD4_9BACT|nr:MAG: dolichyl-phosphate beta-D-mannosyltransferase [Candidatus Glassbacteria bacterium GWA2_58_10]OGG01203.1 MAG: dolichyl-phosphate beta-D-mannosyltransferase [Candidatus Glassbacteria bacterium RIFCSPLOWO2_12_FULL_58_11]
MAEKALVVVPTYNERENIERLIAAVVETGPQVEMLVVDDNSPDGTAKLVEDLAARDNRVHILHRPGKLGLGSAYLAGFRYALERDYQLIFEMDADFSHDPRYLKDFLAASREADLVIGSRYISGINVVNWPMSRLLLSYGASIYTRIITGMPVKDPTAGFKCFRREVLQALDLDKIQSDGYSFQIEVDFKVWRKKFRIKEIPIVFVDRHSGTSKMNRQIVLEAVWMVWWLKIQALLGRL